MIKTTSETITQDLSGFRDATGKTLDEIAKNSELSVPTLISIEKARKKPHRNTVFKLNNYFKDFPEIEKDW